MINRRSMLLLAGKASLALLAACAPREPQPTPTAAPTRTPAPTNTPTALPPGALPDLSLCEPVPVVAPTKPAKLPGFAQLDPTTGLHVTAKYDGIPLADYQLKISGRVAHPQELVFDQLRCLPRVAVEPVLICPGYFEDVSNWAGVPLRHLLGLAGPLEGAGVVTLLGADERTATMSLEEAMLADNLIAYEWEGEPIPILHGFPVRSVMPTMEGNQWIKWLVDIQVE